MQAKPNGFAKTTQEWFEVLIRILGDSPCPVKADAVYIFGETKDNQESSLNKAAELWNTGRAEWVIIDRLGEIVGFPGVEVWRDELQKRNVIKARIVDFELSSKLPPCTDAEALGLVPWLKERNWNNVIAVAPHFHLPRAFISLVSVIVRENLDLSVWSCPGDYLDWQQTVLHSQGIVRGKRTELLSGELNRINAYFEKGNLVSANEVLVYLDKRDSQAK